MPGTLQTGEIVRPDLLQVPRNRFAGLITATSCRRCRWQRRYADVRVFTDVFRDVLTHTHTDEHSLWARCPGLRHQSVVGHAFTACAAYLLSPVGWSGEGGDIRTMPAQGRDQIRLV